MAALRMLFVVLLLAGASSPLVHAQAGNRRTVWSGTVGQRQIVIEERWTPPFTDGLVTVRVNVAGRTSTFEISTAGRSPDLVVPWGTDRLVVLAADMVSIVDLPAELVLDQFLVARPSVSPTGRFIAYARFQPPASRDEDMLLVYDVAAGAQRNRLPSNNSGTEFMRDVGLPVFPEWHTANQKYRGRTVVQGAPLDTLRSAAVWANDTDFVFLTGRGTRTDADASLTMHHVHQQDDGKAPVVRSQKIDVTTVIDRVEQSSPGAAASAVGAQLPYARAIRIGDCAGSACRAEIEWAPTEGLRAPSLHVAF